MNGVTQEELFAEVCAFVQAKFPDALMWAFAVRDIDDLSIVAPTSDAETVKDFLEFVAERVGGPGEDIRAIKNH